MKNQNQNTAPRNPSLNQPLRRSPTSQEIEARVKLLGADPELKTLHQTLVTSGIITDEEFWESRKV
jgi:hypothetical protein